MDPARIAELLQPFFEPTFAFAKNACHSEPTQSGGEETVFVDAEDLIPKISTYIDILLRWNTRINLTAIRNPEEILTRHFGESFFAARHLLSISGANDQRQTASDRRRTYARLTLADVGSGAGFPGMPIKLWAPQISLTLIESNHKKAAFLREITRALTLTDVDIQNTRAEAIKDASFDIITLRAVERFESILPTTARLVTPGGRLALLIGAAQQSAARYALPNFSWPTPVPIPLSQSRVLMIARKEAEPDSILTL
jgi:16S rRNA (guanine527-N7)-methyltransferase